MYEFTTSSGARYRVRNGRISRLTPTIPFDSGPAPVIENVPVTFQTAPTVGEQCYYVLAGDRRPHITSTVKTIERYCTRHDLFNCWLHADYTSPVEDALRAFEAVYG